MNMIVCRVQMYISIIIVTHACWLYTLPTPLPVPLNLAMADFCLCMVHELLVKCIERNCHPWLCGRVYQPMTHAVCAVCMSVLLFFHKFKRNCMEVLILGIKYCTVFSASFKAFHLIRYN